MSLINPLSVDPIPPLILAPLGLELMREYLMSSTLVFVQIRSGEGPVRPELMIKTVQGSLRPVLDGIKQCRCRIYISSSIVYKSH